MQSWGRWLSRAVVVGGLVLLVVVAWRYEPYLTVFGETACKRDGQLCDEVANIRAQRALGWWMLGGLGVLGVGLGLTAIRRVRYPRVSAPEPTAPSAGAPGLDGSTSAPAPDPSPSLPAHAGVAFVRGVLSVGAVVLLFPFWLFGGTALYLALGLLWAVALAWLLDRSHRLRSPGDGDLGALLSSGSAALLAVAVGCSLAVAVPHVVDRPGGFGWFGVVPVVLALGTGLGASAGVALSRIVPPALVGAVLVLALGLLVVTTQTGRALAGDARDDLYPPLSTPAVAVPEPVLPDPIPSQAYTLPPDPPAPTTAPPVVAGRPCVAADLTLSAQGWDSAMGSTAMSVIATNTSPTACWVKGYPGVGLSQGGTDLGLRLTRSTTQRWGNGDDVPDRRVGLAARGGRASFDLWWKGYREAADRKTPQSMTVILRGAEPVELALAAPYLLDVVADAEVTVMRWRVPTPGSG